MKPLRKKRVAKAIWTAGEVGKVTDIQAEETSAFQAGKEWVCEACISDHCAFLFQAPVRIQKYLEVKTKFKLDNTTHKNENA